MHAALTIMAPDSTTGTPPETDLAVVSQEVFRVEFHAVARVQTV